MVPLVLKRRCLMVIEACGDEKGRLHCVEDVSYLEANFCVVVMGS